MVQLYRHPDTAPGAIRSIDAEMERVPGGAVTRFRAVGDISRIVVPARAEGRRVDELWRTTCFELFVSSGADPYAEFNFSPSGNWAAYGFDSYRFGMHSIEAGIEIDCIAEPDSLTLIAKISSEFRNPSSVGLTAVIEETDGVFRYWSTAFGPGKPDFHAPAVRTLLFDGVGTE